ncbi:hypothetical protein [Streptomyces sp. NPDC085596]
MALLSHGVAEADGCCDEILPRRLADDPVGIGAALHLLAWRGALSDG